jgi:argininosuccinate lyase
MAHLLVIESWVGASSLLLPRAITELGHRFTFVTRNLHHYLPKPTAAGVHPLLHADHIVRCETNDLTALLDFVDRLRSIVAFDGVLTSCDYYLEAAAEVAGRFDLPGPAPQGVRTARVKHLMRAALDAAGLPSVRHRVAADLRDARAAAAELGYPLVVKPVDLCAGIHVRCARDESELEEAFSALADLRQNAREQPRPPEVLLEELLDGDEVSVETVTHRGQTQFVAVTGKVVAAFPAFVEAGHAVPAPVAPAEREAAEELVVAALRATGYDHGVAHTEVRLTSRGPRVVEINARLPGNYIPELVRHVTGFDLAQAQVRLALGERPSTTTDGGGAGSAAIRFLLPDADGEVAAIEGQELLARDPAVVAWQVSAAPGQRVRRARDNGDYLGHVVSVDRAGTRAAELASSAAARIRVCVTPDA